MVGRRSGLYEFVVPSAWVVMDSTCRTRDLDVSRLVGLVFVDNLEGVMGFVMAFVNEDQFTWLQVFTRTDRTGSMMLLISKISVIGADVQENLPRDVTWVMLSFHC